jgi:4-amino-4-deoxy-L-arabinose transferase-like glycosyltransferase
MQQILGSSWDRKDRINILFLILLWIFMEILVNPIGEFPLNDDWVHARAVRTLLETGQFTLAGGHSSSNLIAQVYWGALFCLPFGFSFTALRFSAVVLGLAGVLIIYMLAMEMSASRSVAILCALAIAINPIYFGLSNTFMTDVPFLVTVLLGFYFFIRGMQQNHKGWVTAGFLWIYISILIRQLGILFPIAFGLSFLAKRGISKLNLIKAIAPALLGVALNSFYTLWLEQSHRTSPILNQKLGILLDSAFSKNYRLIFRTISSNLLVAIIFISLGVSILLIPLFLHRLKLLPPIENGWLSRLSWFFFWYWPGL